MENGMQAITDALMSQSMKPKQVEVDEMNSQQALEGMLMDLKPQKPPPITIADIMPKPADKDSGGGGIFSKILSFF